MSGESALQGSQDKGHPWSNRRLGYPPNPKIDAKHEWLGGPDASNYRTPPQTRRIKEYCLRRDGHKCMYCLLAAEEYELQVHHVRGADGRTNVANNYSDWVQLFHPDCNVDERWGRTSRRLATHNPQLRTPAPEKADAELSAARKEILDDETTTTSQRTNIENEPEYRRACLKATLDMADPSFKHPDKYMNKRQMMSYAMEMSGSSQDASYGYHRRLFAPRVGPLLEETELGGKIKTVKFRDGKDYKLDIEQLMAKFPKEGQVYSH